LPLTGEEDFDNRAETGCGNVPIDPGRNLRTKLGNH
jgi:hypothetical protein